jgi:(1->4)-alpha-D-glucan 1-alpha-D-glucosylmutase
MPLKDARRIPVATYRLQLHADFNFAEVEKLIPYFHRLGITDLYFSPIFRASPGSLHGYDVSDYRKINPELGGGEGFVRLTEKLRELQMSVLLDFVPNHMGIQGPFNNWWRDVLECGPHSPYASYFDIQWNASREPTRPRVLVPILEAHYGEVLEAGKIALQYQTGAFSLVYGDLRFPVSPDTYPLVLGRLPQSTSIPKSARDALDELIDAFGNLPVPDAVDEPGKAHTRAQTIDLLKRKMHELVENTPEFRAALEKRLEQLNGTPGKPQSFDELDRIIDRQHYRLARWKAGVHEVNYRRFFAVDSLIGLRMENAQVFHESHLLLRHLLRGGWAMGLRIDHIDGLWDPEEYLNRLQGLAQEDGKPEEKPLYVLVEKIRERHEELREKWATHGTTGYEFISQLAGLFVDASNEGRFSAFYRVYAGDETNYEDAVYWKKRLILDEMFANAVTMFGTNLAELVIGDRKWRDLTGHELVTAVREVIANLEVYRTYRRDGTVSPEDRKIIMAACDRAIARNPRFDPHPIEFLRSLLTGDYPAADADPEYRERLQRWCMTLQQYTGAVMAKSVEDTAFYTFARFIALNEVGGNPGVFGGSVDEFHQTNLRRLQVSPHAMLTTSTHDTKVSEDVRARLYTLSEIPAEWEDWVSEWRQAAARHKSVEGKVTAPDPIDEYRLYQILLGAWPIDAVEPDEDFRRRVREHLRKAVNEAKRITSWVNPNEAYLKGCDAFVDAILTRPSGDEFLAVFVPRARRVAHLGIVNSLAQVVLKATVPGVPDFYQGNEMWDFSLVDPDNRRPVDYAKRQELLEKCATRSPRQLMQDWQSGAIKMWTTHKLLALRREFLAVFQRGDYEPCSTGGRYQRHAIGYRRKAGGITIAVVVPRLSALLGVPPLGLVWDDTHIDVGEASGDWEDWFTGIRYPAGQPVPLANLFEELPYAVLINRSTAS